MAKINHKRPDLIKANNLKREGFLNYFDANDHFRLLGKRNSKNSCDPFQEMIQALVFAVINREAKIFLALAAHEEATDLFLKELKNALLEIKQGQGVSSEKIRKLEC